MDELKCSVCGSPVNAGDSFCQNCGNPIQPQKQEETVMPEVTEPTVAVTPEVTEPTPIVAETTETIEAVQPEYEAVSAQPEEKTATNPFSLAEEDTAAAQTGTYQQTGAYQGSYYGQQAQMGAQQPQMQKKPSKAAGIVGLILGILGLLTSACGIMVIPLIFCLVGIILAIVCLAKKSSKGLGISGLIVSILGLISGLIFMFLVLGVLSSAGTSLGEMDLEEIINTLEDNSSDGSLDYVPGDYDSVYTDDKDGKAEVLPSSFESLSDANQIMINGIVYTLPISLSNSGFSINEQYEEDMDSLADDGWAPGNYKFVLLDSSDGTSVYGFVENMSDATIYSEADLMLSGLNVDNYSCSTCAEPSVMLANGITLGTSKVGVLNLLGEPDDTVTEGVYYESADGYTNLYLEYDEDDNVKCIEITVYKD